MAVKRGVADRVGAELAAHLFLAAPRREVERAGAHVGRDRREQLVDALCADRRQHAAAVRFTSQVTVHQCPPASATNFS
jgi:hypothetical protein